MVERAAGEPGVAAGRVLDDGAYVECAGLMENSDYARKMAYKREPASDLGIPLIVIGPSDLYRLQQIFATQRDIGQPPCSTARGAT